MVTSGEREGGRRKIGVRDKEAETTMFKINKLQRCNVQHRDYSQYVIWSIICKNIKSQGCTDETNIIL